MSQLTATVNEGQVLAKSDLHREKEIQSLRSMLENMEYLDQDELDDFMGDLQEVYRDEKGNYETVRERYFCASISMNEIGLLAPAFRKQLHIPWSSKKRKPIHEVLLRDQIVIDCHWLHCKKVPVDGRWREMNSIMNVASDFDFAKVEAVIAAKKWTADFRVNELLYLTDFQQHQLFQLRNYECKNQHRLLLDGKRKEIGRSPALISPVRVAIRKWAEDNQSIRSQIKTYESLWLSRELLGSKASNPQIAELAALIEGRKPLDRTTVRDKLKRLDRVLGALPHSPTLLR